jgi:hypothetical protein
MCEQLAPQKVPKNPQNAVFRGMFDSCRDHFFFRKSKRANPSGLALDFLVEHAQCPLGRAGRVFIVLQSGGIRACLPDPG